MAYFYFDFRDLSKQACHDLLLSLVSQLSTRSSPYCDLLHRVYKTHENGTRQPSDDTLKGCFKELLRLPGQGPIFIVLDALDECHDWPGIPSPRDEVLSLVEELVDIRLEELHICVTSRPESDIRAVLAPLTMHLVSLHDEIGQMSDIADYVRSVVNSSPCAAMRRWKPGRVWTFVERIQDNENRTLSQQSQHLFQTFLQSVITGLLSAIFVCGVNAIENVTARTRGIRKLGYEGEQQVVAGLLPEIPEIEVIVCHDA